MKTRLSGELQDIHQKNQAPVCPPCIFQCLPLHAFISLILTIWSMISISTKTRKSQTSYLQKFFPMTTDRLYETDMIAETPGPLSYST